MNRADSTSDADALQVRAAAESDFSSLFDFLPIGAYRSSPEGRPLRANRALVLLNGYETEAEMTAAIQDIATECYVDPGRRAAFRARMERDGFVRGFIAEAYRHKTRERIWVSENAHAVRDAAGQILFFEGTVEDITDRMARDMQQLQREEIWKLALESTGDGVWDWDLSRNVAELSQRCLDMYGLTAEEVHADPKFLLRRTHPDDAAQLRADRRAYLEGRTPTYANERRIQCKDGSWKWVLTRGMVIGRDARGRPLRMVGTYTDITQRKEAEALIWQQAHFDPLTGLPNRRMLRDRLAQQMARCGQGGRQFALLFIDLDHFKAVNDTMGHQGGDALLVEATRRLQRSVRRNDTVARMGGDEFTVLLSDLQEARDVEVVVHDILRALASEFWIGTERAFVTASIGVTLYPGDARSVDDLLRQADQALYVAKGAGRNRFAYFTRALQDNALQRARLANDLHSALASGQFLIEYQPIVALATGQVHQAEALLRWHHPVRGMVSPEEFVPVAESTSLIIGIGEWAFREAARQVLDWRQRIDPRFQISVNKSPAQFHRAKAVRQEWLRVVASLKLPRRALTVEITEGLLLDPSPDVANHLVALRAAGVGVSLDDFGTGYSSLSYLQMYDIDYIKIDKSFISGLAPDSNDLVLCKAMIVMAHQLGISVIAEGVETQLQRDLLQEAGCDYVQGYLYAPPMDAARFEAWLAARQP